MIWLSLIFNDGDKTAGSFSLRPSDSVEMKMNLEGRDIAFYKVFMPEFSGHGVFVQIMDQKRNIISDEMVETKMSVGYFDFEESGSYVMKVTNLSKDQINVDIELGDTNGREMILPGIVILTGGLMTVVMLYIKLRDYRMAQPDENIS